MEKKTNNKLKIGFSIGDYNGIGPEILLKAFSKYNLFEKCIPIVFCSKEVLNFYKDILDINIKIEDLENPVKDLKENQINCFFKEKIKLNIKPGLIENSAGKYAELSLYESLKSYKNDLIECLITLPISKINTYSESFKYPGHTEFLESEFVNNNSMMIMHSKEIIIGFITGHIPVTHINKYINKNFISEKFKIFINSLKNDFNIKNPRVAVLGLNPHSGEDGLLGKEEKEIIMPLMDNFNKKNKLFFGPYSSDSFFGLKTYNKFDGVISFYHDQGLVGFKSISFDNGVNYTSGLPIIRSSPDHGTAFNIAGKGVANELSFLNSVLLNIKIFNNRKLYK
ncbi:MAG: 4-hydroxythreonine-4-phosphate dehydrogenase PdxA [Flammeovirgaceae bacterium]|nr:4-hydroxythreonine-4-phosphate dehydrogenase PdxA [Flammeovirgaceae bacterium]